MFNGDRARKTTLVEYAPKKLHPEGVVPPIGGPDLHRVPPHPEHVALKGDVVALVADGHQLFQQVLNFNDRPHPQGAAIQHIYKEMEERVAFFESENKLIEAQRIKQRTMYDIEMMQELGYCSGIENYSRVIEGRPVGSPPHTLLDYFPKDFVLFIEAGQISTVSPRTRNILRSKAMSLRS